MKGDHLSDMDGDMVSGANFLDGGDYDLEMDESGGVSSKHTKSLENLYEKFDGYCNELAMFGFNSSGYDVKLIKTFLFKELCEHGQQLYLAVKNLESTHALRPDT